jgi:soluble lytic murein transglycosylase-like protein
MTTEEIKQQIVDTAKAQGLDPNLALAVAQQESSFNPNALAREKNGSASYGLFQINNSNFTSMGITNPLDVTQNINAGVSYLAKLFNQYGGDVSKTLSAYSGGPGLVANGFVNTNYVNGVMSKYQAFAGQGETVATVNQDYSLQDTTQTNVDTGSVADAFVGNSDVVVGVVAVVGGIVLAKMLG